MRPDGREWDQLREIKVQPSVLKEADGSAFVKWGKNLVIAGVFGPRECIPKHDTNPYKAIIKVRYSMAPFSTEDDRVRPGPSRRSIEISKVLRHVFENVVIAEKYPGTEIDVFVEVLRSDAGTRIASLLAGMAALVDAGIALNDMAVGVAVGKYQGKIIVDLNKIEDNEGEVDMPLAINMGTGEILLLQMDGVLTPQEFEQALDLAVKKAREVGEIMRRDIKERYKKPPEQTVLDEVFNDG